MRSAGTVERGKGRQRRQPSGARTSKTQTRKSKGRRQAPATRQRGKRTGVTAATTRQSPTFFAVATATMKHLEELRTPDTMVNSDVLAALCFALLKPSNGEMMWFDTYCIPIRGLHYNWARIQLWDKRLALEVVQPATRLLIPIFAACHYSLLEVDMGKGVIRHHDSLQNGHQTHGKVQEWYTMAKNMVGCFREKRGWNRQPQMKVDEQHDRRLHTQQSSTNTCLVHTFNFMATIQQHGRPIPLDDRVANTRKRTEFYDIFLQHPYRTTTNRCPCRISW